MFSDFDEWEIFQCLVQSGDLVSLVNAISDLLVFSDELQKLDEVIFSEIDGKLFIKTFSESENISGERGCDLNGLGFFKEGDLIESDFMRIDKNRLDGFSELFQESIFLVLAILQAAIVEFQKENCICVVILGVFFGRLGSSILIQIILQRIADSNILGVSISS